ncbi:MAG: helix-turn-helix domain-containing protein [Firmicutes bacterium]|nr:helix-turn-helix domain-containing protein [Bacillota bacterium]
MSAFGRYLKKLREDRDMSIRQLALRSGVSSPYISQIETGARGVPRPEVLKKLARGLRVPYMELMKVAGYIDEEGDKDKLSTRKAASRKDGYDTPLSPEAQRAIEIILNELRERDKEGL